MTERRDERRMCLVAAGLFVAMWLGMCGWVLSMNGAGDLGRVATASVCGMLAAILVGWNVMRLVLFGCARLRGEPLW